MNTSRPQADIANDFQARLDQSAKADLLDRLIADLHLSSTYCPRGVVLLFSRLDGGTAPRDAPTFGYVQLPLADSNPLAGINGVQSDRFGSTCQESILASLQGILLGHLGAGVDLHDRFTCLIAAAICIFAECYQWCFSAQRRSRVGGLALWQEGRAKSYLEEHISEPLAVEEIARLCGMSTPHFSRSFKVSTGHPPYRWLLKKRVELAKKLLETSSATIIEVSMECGFTEQSHFTKTFRQQVGMTPGAWRQVHRRRKVSDSSRSNSSR